MRLDWRIPLTVAIVAIVALLWLVFGVRWAVGFYLACGLALVAVAFVDASALPQSLRERLTLPFLWLPALWSDRLLAWIRR